MQHWMFVLGALLATQVLRAEAPASIRVAGEVSFEVSQGVAFARGTRGGFWTNGAAMRFGSGDNEVRLVLEGAREGVRAEPLEPLRRTTHYILGRGSAGMRTVSQHFGRVRFPGVYPNVDLIVYGAGTDVEYDFDLRPGADPRSIVLAFDRAMELQTDGSVVFSTASGGLRQHAPRAFQGGEAISARYRRIDDRRLVFDLGPYDASRPLTIDPRISLASFFGGVGADRIQDVAFDARGDMWIAGQTNSPDFPLPPNGFPSTRRGASDVFVSKLERQTDAAGAESWRLATTLFLGGAGRDRAVGVAVDSAGRVYVLGDTQSRDFPISNDAEQRGFAGGTDSFVTVLRETDFPFFSLGEEGRPGQSGLTNYEIEYSTLYGGAGEDVAARGRLSPFAEDRNLPCAVLAGQTTSADLKTSTFAAQEQHGGGTDAYFAVFCRQSGAGYPLLYGTFLGGNREEAGGAMAVASSGSFCIATRTFSANLPSTGLQRAWAGSTDLYLGCFAPVRRRFGLPFLYRELGRTFWGGSGAEAAIALEMQDTGTGTEEFRVFVLAETASEDLPAAGGVPIPAGGSTANPGSRSLLIGAFPSALDDALTQFWLGGRSQETGADLALSGGCLAVAGRTTSADFPTSATFPERPLSSGEDVAAGKFCFNEAMTSATTVYLGAYGTLADDPAAALTAGPFDDEVIAGWTTAPGGAAPEIPETSGAPRQGFAGGVEDGLLFGLHRPRLQAEAIVGAADFLSRPIAPGQILSIFGLGIGPGAAIGTQLDESGRLRRDLGGVRVLFDGVAAPMVFVSRNQVSVVAPFFLDVRQSVSVQVETQGAASEPVALAVASAAPAVFTLSQNGSGQAAVLNEDSSVNGESRPAAPGSLLQIFLTGVGQTAPRGVDGELIPPRQPFPQIIAPVAVRIGGLDAAVIYAGGAPGQVHGVAQINAVTPRGLLANPRTSLEITIGGASTQPGVTVAIAGAP